MIKEGKAPFHECSTKGDRRFSAFCARIKAAKGQSVEELYQAVKVFEDGATGLTWREAKGKKAVNMEYAVKYYRALWVWYVLVENPSLWEELQKYSGLSDIFGREGSCCQASELWYIRNIPKELHKLAIENAREVLKQDKNQK